jgi:AcrR family transcriptional regulator
MDLTGEPSSSRPYHSDIRARQVATTRRRILDALVEVMAEGPAEVTVPAVATRAGVSVPTVYRHFGDRPGLLTALVPHVGERLDMGSEAVPRTLDELGDSIRRLFTRLKEADPAIRAALASGANPEARRRAVELRMDALEALLRDLDVPSSRVEGLARIIVILTCSDALRLWTDRFEIDTDEVAENVILAVQALIAGSRP